MAYFIIFLTFISILFYLYRFQKTNDILLLLPIFYNFVVLYVVFGVYVLTYATEDPFHLYSQISNTDVYNASFLFIISSFCFYIGGALFKKKRSRQATVNNKNNVFIRYQKILILLILTIYLLFVVGYGAEGLVYRRGYVDSSFEHNKTIILIFHIVAPFVTILIPFIKTNALKYLTYLMCFLILFSSSSRYIVLVPFLYVLGTFLRYNKVKLNIIFLNGCLIFLSLIFVLQIRFYTFHGLIPNLMALFTKGIDIEYLFLGLNYVFSFSLFGVSYVLKNFTHDNVAFLISINPLPSRFINIKYMVLVQEMKRTAPMSAVSILALAGYPILISFYLATGFCFSFIHKRMEGKTFFYYLIVCLFIMFTLFSIQYNLRGLCRFFYYSFLVFIMYSLLKKSEKKAYCMNFPFAHF